MESCFWKKKKKKRTKRIYILDDLYKIIFKGNYYCWQFIWINRNSNASIQFCLKFHDFMESCFWKKKKKKRTKRYTRSWTIYKNCIQRWLLSVKIARSIGEFIWINCECKARRDRRRKIPHARITGCAHDRCVHSISYTVYNGSSFSVSLSSTLRLRVFLRLSNIVRRTLLHRGTRARTRAKRIENPSRCISLASPSPPHRTMTHFALRPFPLFPHRGKNLPRCLALSTLKPRFVVLKFLMGISDGGIPTGNDVGCDKKGVEHALRRTKW